MKIRLLVGIVVISNLSMLHADQFSELMDAVARGDNSLPALQTVLDSVKTNKKELTISKEALQTLKNYNWPGNIRELKNIIERSVILMQDSELNIDDLPFEIRQHALTSSTGNNASMAAMEQNHIRNILRLTKGNKSEAARILEIGVATLYRKIEEYKL